MLSCLESFVKPHPNTNTQTNKAVLNFENKTFNVKCMEDNFRIIPEIYKIENVL